MGRIFGEPKPKDSLPSQRQMAFLLYGGLVSVLTLGAAGFYELGARISGTYPTLGKVATDFVKYLATR